MQMTMILIKWSVASIVRIFINNGHETIIDKDTHDNQTKTKSAL